MQVAVLGPLDVRRDDLSPLPVPGAEERLLLAVLAAGAPSVVSTDRLVEALWNGEPPDSAVDVLHSVVVRLRGCLEPGLPANASGRYVLRRGAGYVLAVARGDIDALRLGTLAERGSARLAAGDAVEAARVLSAALRLWRGDPYADWPDAAFAREERHRLTALRARVEAALQDAQQAVVDRRTREPARSRVLEPPSAPSFGRTWGPPVAVDAGWGSPPPDEVAAEQARTDTHPATGPVEEPATRRARRPVGVVVLAGIVVATVAVAGLAIRSQRQAQDAGVAAAEVATVAEAARLAGRATTGPLDLSLLLAVQAVRLADTSDTRGRLAALLAEHPRVQRIGRFSGIPQDAVLAGRDPTLVFGAGNDVVAWPIGAGTQPRTVLDIPGEWGSWRAAFASPVESAVVGAGIADRGLWLRMVSAVDGSSRVLLEDDGFTPLPVAGAVTPDGSRFHLLVAEPDAAAPHASRWRVIEVDVTAGTRRDTGTGGIFPAPIGALAADFAQDAGSVVLWADGRGDSAVLVDLADGRQTPIRVRRPSTSPGLRALPTGAAQLWSDGVIVLLDPGGTPIQELDAHPAPVYDVTVSPDGTWAVSAGAGGAVLLWTVDPATGSWSERDQLSGHVGGVVGVETDSTGRTLVTVGLDSTAISWDPGPVVAPAPPGTDAAALVRRACAIVARDFSPREWVRYLPDRPYAATCTDLL